MSTDDLQRTLGRLEGEVRGLRQSLEAVVTAHEARIGAHSDKIRALELWRAYLAGGGTVLVGVVAYLLWAVNFVWGR